MRKRKGRLWEDKGTVEVKRGKTNVKRATIKAKKICNYGKHGRIAGGEKIVFKPAHTQM
jgi:hypothetical protein